MDQTFWWRMHGGSTHFPIALTGASLLFHFAAWAFPATARSRELRAAGDYTLFLGALSCFAAVASGLILSKWQFLGTGLTARHHLFVWPSFTLIVGLALWRFLARQGAERQLRGYLVALVLAFTLISIAGFWGGEMLIGN